MSPTSERVRARQRQLLLPLLAALLLAGSVTGVVGLLGVRLATLGSASMAPWADVGALLVHRTVRAADLEPGDVVSLELGDGLLTHRVVSIEPRDGDAFVLRLRGDANTAIDPEPRIVEGEVLLAVSAIDGLGRALRVAAPLFWSGTGLVLLGWATLAARRRADDRALLSLGGDAPKPIEASGDVQVGPTAPRPPAALDPRIEALLATAEELVEQGMAPIVARDLVRVRVCELLALPSVERSGAVRSLDDGGRFYVLALVDADPDALALVPLHSTRRRAGTRAVERWWSAVDAAVPAAVLVAAGPYLTPDPAPVGMTTTPGPPALASSSRRHAVRTPS